MQWSGPYADFTNQVVMWDVITPVYNVNSDCPSTQGTTEDMDEIYLMN